MVLPMSIYRVNRFATHLAFGFLAFSVGLASCQSPSETRAPQSANTSKTIAPTVTYKGSTNRSAPNPNTPQAPNTEQQKPGQLTFKIKVDRNLIQGFGIQQLSNCAQALTQLQTTLTLADEVSAASQTALEQQGITVTNANGKSTLTFSNTLAEVDQDTLEITYTLNDLPQGAAVAQTVIKDDQSQDFGFVDYSVSVDTQGSSDLNMALNATENLSSIVACPQLAAEVNGGTLSATGGDVILPIPTPTPTPSAPVASIAVAPTLDNISTTTGPPATQVIITGTGLDTIENVTFGDVPAFEFTIDSDTQITAYSSSVNPVAGTVKVVNSAGEAVSTETFTPILGAARRLFATPNGNGDGSSWGNGMSLRYALGSAQPGDEVWVQAGIHTPAPADGNRSQSFVTNANVKIYGGFSGGEPLLEQRDPETHITILSGDLNGDDDYSDDSIDDLINNAFHVVVGAEQVILDGFTITGGFSGGIHAEDRQGAGLRLVNQSMTVENVIFNNNISGFAGGAIYHEGATSLLTLTNVHFEDNNAAFFGGAIFSARGATGTGNNLTFVRNTSKQGGAIVNDAAGLNLNGFTFDDNGALYSGGAIYNRNGSSPTLQNGTFENNLASNGGAVYNTGAGSNLRLERVLFENNDADNGGAMYNYDYASPVLEQVTFKGNLANFLAGAMYNYSYASPTMNRVAFSDNAASRGGGMYNRSHASPTIVNGVFHNNIATDGGGGGIYNYNASSPKMLHLTFYNNLANALGGTDIFSTLLCEPELTSSVIWGDGDDPLFQDADRQIHVLNSSVKDLDRVNNYGLSNLNLDPFFVDPANPAGPDGVFMTGDDGLRLTTTSPAKNFGSGTEMPVADILGALRVGPNPEQGAYEGSFDGVLLPLQIEDLVVGSGPGVADGDVLVVDYIGTTQSGVEFDNSYTSGSPLTFTLGAGGVIPGWEQGLQGMQKGGKRRLIVPPHLGYGAQWIGLILPNSTLTFEIELLDVNP